MAKNYISQLIKDQALGELERTIELEFSLEPIKVVVFRYSDMNELIAVLADRQFKLIKGYKITEFECRPIQDSVLPHEFKDMRKSNLGWDDAHFRRFYLRFMAKKYDTFAADYRALKEKQVAYDLGETASL